jgi:hypothetical protein
MSADEPDLARLQRWMQAVIMHPDGVEAGVRGDEARREIPVDPGEVEDIITRSRALPALERLAVYGHAYHARLLECLADEFPVLQGLLGEEAFNTLAAGYLQRYPSRSYTLMHLGDRLPQFLEETCPQAEEGDLLPPGWTAFVIDLARLEWTFNQVFDGPGIEGGAVLDADALAGVPPERWPAARLVPVPCLRLLALRCPVDEYFRAVRAGEEPAPVLSGEVFLAVTRRDYVVRHSRLEKPEYHLLESLVAGRRVGEAIAEVAGEPGIDPEGLAGALHRWFHDWAARGFFLRVELPG